MRSRPNPTLYFPSPRLNQLLILRELQSKPRMTQAELARRTELSVAMVNNYMKELESAGLIEYHRKSTRVVSYHVTPSGREQLAALYEELIRELARQFAFAKDQLRGWIQSRAGSSAQRIVLVGAGELAELAFHAVESGSMSVVAVCEADSGHVAPEWCARRLMPLSQVRSVNPDAIVVAELEVPPSLDESLRRLEATGLRVVRFTVPASSDDRDSAPCVPVTND